jgi:L-aspartate oxidase
VLPAELRPWSEPAADGRTAGLVSGTMRAELQDVMTSRAGVLRTADGLAEAAELLDKLGATQTDIVDLESWETTNLLTVSTALATAAALREETRGSHWREDFPDRDDERFAGHFDATMADGATTIAFRSAPPSDGVTG